MLYQTKFYELVSTVIMFCYFINLSQVHAPHFFLESIKWLHSEE